MFQDNSKLCLSQNSIESDRNYSKSIPNGVLAKFYFHLLEIILRNYQIVSWPNSNSLSSKIFQDNSELCLSQNSNASDRNYSKPIPHGVLAKF